MPCTKYVSISMCHPDEHLFLRTGILCLHRLKLIKEMCRVDMAGGQTKLQCQYKSLSRHGSSPGFVMSQTPTDCEGSYKG